MEDFDGKDLAWVREGSIWEMPVSPKWEVNSIQAKRPLCVAGVDGNFGWVKVSSEGFERRKNTCGGLRLVLEGIPEFFVRGGGQVGCLSRNASERGRFWSVYDVGDKWCEAIPNVASTVRQPASMLRCGLERVGDEIQTRVG